MPRKYSLYKKKDFDTVFKVGRRIKTPVLIILFTRQEIEAGYPRFGIMVSKKNFPKAYRRNKIRRQIKEIIHFNLKTTGLIDKNLDFVILVNKNFADKSFEENKEILSKSLNF